MGETMFVVSPRGVVHVPYCPAAQRSKSVLPWAQETQVHGDRRCMRCFPAVNVGKTRRPNRQPPFAAQVLDTHGWN